MSPHAFETWGGRITVSIGWNPRLKFGHTNQRGYGGAGIWGDSLGAISHIKLSQGAFRGSPPVALVSCIPASWFPSKMGSSLVNCLKSEAAASYLHNASRRLVDTHAPLSPSSTITSSLAQQQGLVSFALLGHQQLEKGRAVCTGTSSGVTGF